MSELDVHLLMNHSLPGVNAGYITRDKLLRDHLRTQQERISAIVFEKAGKTLDDSLLLWLTTTKLDAGVEPIRVLNQAAQLAQPQVRTIQSGARARAALCLVDRRDCREGRRGAAG
ncbi:hypothetical protein MPC1_260001 [Methylocella tundrae]|nr:hypothetical protein MPC1_260001 [Methylocella tundrae]